MSYEYKYEIIEDVKAHCKTKNKNIAVYPVYHYEDKVEEIHIVYAMAEKADDYEAKAKAYNDTLKTLDKLINDDERYKEARSNDFIAGMLIAYENIFNLMEDYIKESGECDAKK